MTLLGVGKSCASSTGLRVRDAINERDDMYIGLGIVLLVLGAILNFDVITVNIPHVNEHALGTILMIGGILAIGLSFSLRDRYRRGTDVEDDAPVVGRRRSL